MPRNLTHNHTPQCDPQAIKRFAAIKKQLPLHGVEQLPMAIYDDVIAELASELASLRIKDADAMHEQARRVRKV